MTGAVHSQTPTSTIGVILVHGIGEQRRFEHLDGQLRYLIKAIPNFDGFEAMSVDIAPASAAAFHADQDTWGSGPQPSVTVVVKHRIAGAICESRILVHEVYWAKNPKIDSPDFALPFDEPDDYRPNK